MSMVVLVNAGAGSTGGDDCEELKGRVAAFCRDASLPATVTAVAGKDLERELQKAVACPRTATIVVGGGDGTIRTGAGLLAGTGKRLGVLPLGTLNHFARDLGIPPELDAGLRVIASGSVRDVDVAEVNGHVFINNCSLGLYPEAVRQRERLRQHHGLAKWRAMGQGAWEALKRFPVVRLRLRTAQGSLSVATPQLVVGNNRYETRLLALGRRAALDRGELWVYAALARSRFGFLRLVLRTLTNRLDPTRDFLSMCTDELEIDRRHAGRVIRLTLDGEILDLRGPLRFRSRPRALKVLAPPPS
jgi:diacylglycerol kinase family enzyme